MTKFLESKIWWWRNLPEVISDRFITDQIEQWPHCHLAGLYLKANPKLPLPAIPPADAVGKIRALTKSLGWQKNIRHWWHAEQGGAIAYEFAARIQGAYPDREPYIRLSRDKRQPWFNRFLDLDVAELAVEAPELVPAVVCAPTAESNHGAAGPLTALTAEIRLNLACPNDLILRSVKNLIRDQRKLLPKPSPHRSRPSWRVIESIDLACHAGFKLDPAQRKALQRLRRALFLRKSA